MNHELGKYACCLFRLSKQSLHELKPEVVTSIGGNTLFTFRLFITFSDGVFFFFFFSSLLISLFIKTRHFPPVNTASAQSRVVAATVGYCCEVTIQL